MNPNQPLYNGYNTFPELHIADHDPNTDMNQWIDTEDWHSVVSIQLGELIRSGVVVWGEPPVLWNYYDEEQYWRVSEMIEQHYFYREIGIVPPGQWMLEFKRHMNEQMRKYRILYKALEDGIDMMQIEDRYGKSRDIGSNFPQTSLKTPNRDYASDSHDRQYEDVVNGNFLDQFAKLTDYEDVDVLLVTSCDKLFSSLLTVSINGGNY